MSFMPLDSRIEHVIYAISSVHSLLERQCVYEILEMELHLSIRVLQINVDVI
jgi:hypothetical protein